MVLRLSYIGWRLDYVIPGKILMGSSDMSPSFDSCCILSHRRDLSAMIHHLHHLDPLGSCASLVVQVQVPGVVVQLACVGSV